VIFAIFFSFFITDYENEDVVTQQSFANILKKFGPLERIAETVRISIYLLKSVDDIVFNLFTY